AAPDDGWRREPDGCHADPPGSLSRPPSGAGPPAAVDNNRGKQPADSPTSTRRLKLVAQAGRRPTLTSACAAICRFSLLLPLSMEAWRRGSRHRPPGSPMAHGVGPNVGLGRQRHADEGLVGDVLDDRSHVAAAGLVDCQLTVGTGALAEGGVHVLHLYARAEFVDHVVAE